MGDTPRKYEFTGVTKEHHGRTLHQIRAVVSFGVAAAGTVGGWIETEANLSHTGKAWVSDNAMAYDNSRVYGNAWVTNDARVYGNARVSGSARVSGNAQVYGNARVSRTPKCLTGFLQTVTVTDHHVAVGFRMYPQSVLRDRGAAILRDAGHLDEAQALAAIINAIAEAHGCVDAPVDGEDTA